MAGDYATLAAEYEEQRPTYVLLSESLRASIEESIANLGLNVIVIHRAKTVQSFVKKAIRGNYQRALTDVTDLAGVRVIATYTADVDEVESAVRECCTVVEREQKLDALAFNEFGYLGVHLGVEANENLVEDHPEFQGLRAEIQIHTRAQSAWASATHELDYKSPIDLSAEMKRSISRLVALVELFDGEMSRLREEIVSDPIFQDFVALAPLDNYLLRFTSEPPDRAISAIFIHALLSLYPDCPPEQVVKTHINPFLAEEETKLRRIYDRYNADPRANPLLTQPEVFLIFERLTHDQDKLRDSWHSAGLPFELLEDLALIWGVNIG